MQPDVDVVFATPRNGGSQGTNRYGQYVLDIPDVGRVEYPRVTTITGTLTSNDGLRVWTERNIVRGLGVSPALRAELAAAGDDKDALDKVIDRAKDAARIGEAAEYGTAVHRLLEMYPPDVPLPDHMRPVAGGNRELQDLAAARSAIASIGYVVSAESMVANVLDEYSGRIDFLIRCPDGEQRILDVKTSKDVLNRDKRLAYGAQLALYAHATHIYDQDAVGEDGAAGQWDRVGPGEFGGVCIDLEVGYILHVRDGVAAVYEVDLVEGWQAARAALALYRARKRSVGFDRFKPHPGVESGMVLSEGPLANIRSLGELNKRWEAHGGSWTAGVVEEAKALAAKLSAATGHEY